MKNDVLWVETHTGAGEDHEEEEMAETQIYEITTLPISHAPVPLDQGRR